MTNAPEPECTVSPGSQRRHELIRQIEAKRKSKVMTYVLSDRTGAQAKLRRTLFAQCMIIYERSLQPERSIFFSIRSVGIQTSPGELLQ